MASQMKIGELAEAAGIAPSRIRFYEKIGLFKAATRQANGYRSYPPQAVTLLKLIDQAQQAGFSLDELKTLLPTDIAQWDHDALVTAIREKVTHIEQLQSRLEKSRVQLQQVLSEVENRPDDLSCAENAKRVLFQFGLLPKAEVEK